ncbi:DUF721 domain-containing protein [bacterium]|nr:DUF721 domain-containing protein [bacterium]
MKKILYTKFQYIDELIAQLGEQKEFKRAIRRSNLYKFWAKAAGEKFAKYSKPYSMLKGNIMVIACKTPTVAQELLLCKTQLLNKLKPYTESLKINVTDLKFDSKKWSED